MLGCLVLVRVKELQRRVGATILRRCDYNHFVGPLLAIQPAMAGL
jgi:hypothetical protein